MFFESFGEVGSKVGLGIFEFIVGGVDFPLVVGGVDRVFPDVRVLGCEVVLDNFFPVVIGGRGGECRKVGICGFLAGVVIVVIREVDVVKKVNLLL